MNAAMPPAFWASAMAWMASVVLPDDSGPKISMTRPLGYPPTPSAMSRVIDPVGITGMSFTSVLFIRMIDPLPKSFSIFSITAFKTLSLSGFTCTFSAMLFAKLLSFFK